MNQGLSGYSLIHCSRWRSRSFLIVQLNYLLNLTRWDVPLWSRDLNQNEPGNLQSWTDTKKLIMKPLPVSWCLRTPTECHSHETSDTGETNENCEKTPVTPVKTTVKPLWLQKVSSETSKTSIIRKTIVIGKTIDQWNQSSETSDTVSPVKPVATVRQVKPVTPIYSRPVKPNNPVRPMKPVKPWI